MQEGRRDGRHPALTLTLVQAAGQRRVTKSGPSRYQWNSDRASGLEFSRPYSSQGFRKGGGKPVRIILCRRESSVGTPRTSSSAVVDDPDGARRTGVVLTLTDGRTVESQECAGTVRRDGLSCDCVGPEAGRGLRTWYRVAGKGRSPGTRCSRPSNNVGKWRSIGQEGRSHRRQSAASPRAAPGRKWSRWSLGSTSGSGGATDTRAYPPDSWISPPKRRSSPRFASSGYELRIRPVRQAMIHPHRLRLEHTGSHSGSVPASTFGASIGAPAPSPGHPARRELSLGGGNLQPTHTREGSSCIAGRAPRDG